MVAAFWWSDPNTQTHQNWVTKVTDQGVQATVQNAKFVQFRVRSGSQTRFVIDCMRRGSQEFEAYFPGQPVLLSHNGKLDICSNAGSFDTGVSRILVVRADDVIVVDFFLEVLDKDRQRLLFLSFLESKPSVVLPEGTVTEVAETQSHILEVTKTIRECVSNLRNSSSEDVYSSIKTSLDINFDVKDKGLTISFGMQSIQNQSFGTCVELHNYLMKKILELKIKNYTKPKSPNDWCNIHALYAYLDVVHQQMYRSRGFLWTELADIVYGIKTAAQSDRFDVFSYCYTKLLLLKTELQFVTETLLHPQTDLEDFQSTWYARLPSPTERSPKSEEYQSLRNCGRFWASSWTWRLFTSFKNEYAACVEKYNHFKTSDDKNRWNFARVTCGFKYRAIALIHQTTINNCVKTFDDLFRLQSVASIRGLFFTQTPKRVRKWGLTARKIPAQPTMTGSVTAAVLDMCSRNMLDTWFEQLAPLTKGQANRIQKRLSNGSTNEDVLEYVTQTYPSVASPLLFGVRGKTCVETALKENPFAVLKRALQLDNEQDVIEHAMQAIPQLANYRCFKGSKRQLVKGAMVAEMYPDKVRLLVNATQQSNKRKPRTDRQIDLDFVERLRLIQTFSPDFPRPFEETYKLFYGVPRTASSSSVKCIKKRFTKTSSDPFYVSNNRDEGFVIPYIPVINTQTSSPSTLSKTRRVELVHWLRNVVSKSVHLQQIWITLAELSDPSNTDTIQIQESFETLYDAIPTWNTPWRSSWYDMLSVLEGKMFMSDFKLYVAIVCVEFQISLTTGQCPNTLPLLVWIFANQDVTHLQTFLMNFLTPRFEDICAKQAKDFIKKSCIENLNFDEPEFAKACVFEVLCNSKGAVSNRPIYKSMLENMIEMLDVDKMAYIAHSLEAVDIMNLNTDMLDDFSRVIRQNGQVWLDWAHFMPPDSDSPELRAEIEQYMSAKIEGQNGLIRTVQLWFGVDITEMSSLPLEQKVLFLATYFKQQNVSSSDTNLLKLIDGYSKRLFRSYENLTAESGELDTDMYPTFPCYELASNGGFKRPPSEYIYNIRQVIAAIQTQKEMYNDFGFHVVRGATEQENLHVWWILHELFVSEEIKNPFPRPAGAFFEDPNSIRQLLDKQQWAKVREHLNVQLDISWVHIQSGFGVLNKERFYELNQNVVGASKDLERFVRFNDLIGVFEAYAIHFHVEAWVKIKGEKIQYFEDVKTPPWAQEIEGVVFPASANLFYVTRIPNFVYNKGTWDQLKMDGNYGIEFIDYLYYVNKFYTAFDIRISQEQRDIIQRVLTGLAYSEEEFVKYVNNQREDDYFLFRLLPKKVQAVLAQLPPGFFAKLFEGRKLAA